MKTGVWLMIPNPKGFPGLIDTPCTGTSPSSSIISTIKSPLLIAVPPVVISASYFSTYSLISFISWSLLSGQCLIYASANESSITPFNAYLFEFIIIPGSRFIEGSTNSFPVIITPILGFLYTSISLWPADAITDKW